MNRFGKFSLLGGSLLLAQTVFAYDCSNLSTWDSSAVYTGGDQVQHASEAYQANWWNQNRNPADFSGQWQEWSSLGSCDGGGDNRAPIADANGPYSGLVNTAIAFSSAGSSDPDGNIASYQWDFGDGASSSQANPSHIYSQAGDYSVTLTVVDNQGASNLATAVASVTSDDNGGTCNLPQYMAGTQYSAGDQVRNVGRKYRCDIAGWCSSSSAWAYEPGVGSAWQQAWTDTGSCDGGDNQAPIANANGPYSAGVNQSFNFSSAGSSDSDGTIVEYNWSFGDGNSSTEANPSHSFANSGSYSVTLTVTDDQGATGRSNTTAEVTGSGENQAPVAMANGPYFGITGSNISFTSRGSNDPDGSISAYLWNFGDGASSTDAEPSHSYASAGRYDVSLTVTDNQGATNTATTSVTVNDDSGNSGSKVVGYFTNWGVYGRNYHVKNIHTSGSASKLTHIVYAFGNVQNGQCTIGDAYADYDKFYGAADSVDGVADTWDSGALRGNFGQLRRLKAMYPNIKIVWSFGGWTWSGGFGQAAANPQAFANSCYDLVFDPRWADVFDGIDIDWEYPNECGLTCDTSGFNGYRDLMKALRERFGNDKLVTSAIGAGEAKLNAANYGGAAQYLDFYMIMTYDFFGAWAAQGPTAPHSPLYSFDGIPTAGFFTDNGIQVLRSKGVPADKILLGIGFYGRGWTGVTQSTPGGSATGPAPGTYEQGIEDYKVLKTSCPATGTIAGTAYAYCGNNWWSYDTPATINGKMNYLKQQGLGGAFFWELSGDTTNGELINAIDQGLQ
ncbi:glycosyl hydrolase family 18 protein [Pleionea litopenaei]|uniref:chitinase n=1 Tax=Pleionea litopenaei TaxID=3070815 RepID=A0AA51RQU8_9GAMM|nr:glycosyl hydrolase family 18 protein [Pleionea sp. HL-JVS1]WMS85920.1 glycosyl hydrolase family 18 protein [Pleionea sp. HL-JVS1]